MRSCKEIGKLVSESHDRRLSFYERLSVRMHLAMCLLCRNFSKQIQFIRRLTKAAGESGPDSLLVEGTLLDQSLTPEAKSRIKKMVSRGRS